MQDDKVCKLVPILMEEANISRVIQSSIKSNTFSQNATVYFKNYESLKCLKYYYGNSHYHAKILDIIAQNEIILSAQKKLKMYTEDPVLSFMTNELIIMRENTEKMSGYPRNVFK